MSFNDFPPRPDLESQNFGPDAGADVQSTFDADAGRLPGGAEMQGSLAHDAAQEPELRLASEKAAGFAAVREVAQFDKETTDVDNTGSQDWPDVNGPDQADGRTDAAPY